MTSAALGVAGQAPTGRPDPLSLIHLVRLGCWAHVNCYLYHLQFFTFSTFVVISSPTAVRTHSGPRKEARGPSASSDRPGLLWVPRRDGLRGRSYWLVGAATVEGGGPVVRHVPTWQPPRSTAVSPPPTALSPASSVDLGLPGHVPARPASRAWPAWWRPHTHGLRSARPAEFPLPTSQPRPGHSWPETQESRRDRELRRRGRCGASPGGRGWWWGGIRRPTSNGAAHGCIGSTALFLFLLLGGVVGSQEPVGTGSWIGTYRDHSRPQAGSSGGDQHMAAGGAPV